MFKNQQGQIAIFIVFVIMTLLLFISLFLANMTVKQIKNTRNNINSIQAYYLADMGTERLLYGVKRPDGDSDKIDLLDFAVDDEIIKQNNIIEADSSFAVKKTSNFPLQIKTSGVFRETSRAIELSWD